MIEWIGIICCSSLISCVCSLLTTSICLTVTGGNLRNKLKKVGKRKSQDEFSHKTTAISKASENEGNSKKHSFSQIVLPSQKEIDQNQSTEHQPKNAEYSEKLKKTTLKNTCDDSTCQNIIPVPLCCKIPTEAEIQKTIDEFNALFRQYNEIISKNPNEEIKKSPSLIKFQPSDTYEKTMNIGVMTEQENREIVSPKSNSKIKKCRCTTNREIRRHSSSQSVRVAKSCNCSIRKSKSDLCVRKSKSIDKSKYSGHSRHHVNSKPSWISKTIKKFKSKDHRK